TEAAGRPSGKGTTTLRRASRQGRTVEAECRTIRKALESNHVCAEYPAGLCRRVCRALVEPRSEARRILTEGFHRVVLLDAEQGLDASGGFDLALFFHHAADQVAGAFGLELREECLPEDIFQILKDEPLSLFCFLNVHLVPDASLFRLRAFTQELHQT